MRSAKAPRGTTMSDTFACEFQSTEPPFNLTRFCASTTCYGPDEADADRKKTILTRCESCWIGLK